MGEDRSTRNLVLVMGDQLCHQSPSLEGLDPRRDAVWMAEEQAAPAGRASSKLRLAFALSAMRHFREELLRRGLTVHYRPLPDSGRRPGLADILRRDLRRLRPWKLVLTEPGEWALWEMVERAGDELGIDVEVRPDSHFYTSIDEFVEYGQARKKLIMENFYRRMRRKTGILITSSGRPAGGLWNFDKLNRQPFGKTGPGQVRPPRGFSPDALTRSVIAMVERRFGDRPGTTAQFDMPVTRAQSLQILRDFVQNRLAHFGPHQDAMWTDQPFLYHSRLSAALNLHLLDPRELVQAAVSAYEAGKAPINSVEGFVRQVLGWREFVRGIYWLHMPDYLELNELAHDAELPAFYWDGQTGAQCLRQSLRSVLEHGYAHHIQRLMVLGQFALLLGVEPRRFHDWHMAMYLDAVDWVSLPNVLGMSQFADGGLMATKPYCASGRYIDRMSNYCRHCRYRPNLATGEGACPFTTLYWDFLRRHRKRLSRNPRMGLQLRSLRGKGRRELSEIARQAGRVRRAVAAGKDL